MDFGIGICVCFKWYGYQALQLDIYFVCISSLTESAQEAFVGLEGSLESSCFALVALVFGLCYQCSYIKC